MLLSAASFAQVKPNNFTEETAPDNTNFEVYSQKNGVNRRASMYNIKKYMAPSINIGAIDYVPATTGNSTADYAEFVVDPNGDTWYIDMTGRSFLIYAASEDQGVEDAYLSADNDTLFLITVTDTVIVPGLSDLDDQGFSFVDNGTFYKFDLSGTDDDFYLREGANISMQLSGDTVTIAASGGTGSTGEINEGLNLGAGAQVFKEKSDTTLTFRTLEDGGIVTITQGTNDITISATEVDGSITNELQTISISNDTIYLSNGGFVVIPGASDDQQISISNDTVYLEDGGFAVIPATGSTGEINEGLNLGAGAQVFKEKSDTTLTFRTLEDGGIVTITQGTNDITISATEVDGSITNELQTISISNDTIYLSNGGFVVIPGASDDQQISISNDTVYLEDGGFAVIPATDFGTGTTDRIAYWQSNKLASTVWEMNSTYIRGSATGWPHLEDSWLTFRGDTDTGVKRVAANNMGLFAGSTTVPWASFNGSVINFCYDNVATDWQMYNSGFISLNNFFPSLKNGILDFTGDTDTKLSRLTADVMGLHAGDATNPMVRIDGAADQIKFDVNDDTTVEVTMGATGVDIAGTLTVNTFATSPATDAFLGANSNNTVTAVTPGTGMDITANVAYVSLPSLFLSDNNVGSAQTFSVNSSGYDTLTLATNYEIESGITYEAPNPSADEAITFSADGTYEIILTFTGELSTAGTNQTLRMQWREFGGASSAQGSSVSFGFEATARQSYMYICQYEATAGDQLQLLAQSGTGGAATLTMVTPKLSVKFLHP